MVIYTRLFLITSHVDFIIFVHKTLKEIDLEGNNIGSWGMESLAQVLQGKTVIEICFLSKKIEFLCFLIQSLETINLGKNCIDDDGVRCLALALQKNTVILLVVYFIAHIFIVDGVKA